MGKRGAGAKVKLPLALAASAILAGITAFSGNAAFAFLALAALAAAPGLALRRLIPISCVLASIFLGLAMAETGLSFFLPSQKTRIEPPFFQQTALGSMGIPGTHRSRKWAGNGDMLYDVTYTIGPDGFRMSPSDENSDKQINALGCSFTFGEGVNDNQTLPYFLHKALPGAAVKNYDSSGFGVHQALAMLQSGEGAHGKVNLLLTAPWQSERSACIPPYTAGAPRFILSQGKLIRAGACPQPRPALQFLAHSKFLGLLIEQARSLFRDKDAEFELYLALIAEISRLSEQKNQKFVVAFIGAYDSYFKTSHYSNEKILSAIRGSVRNVVDVTLAGKVEALPPEYYIHKEDTHPTPLANAARAGIIAPVLAKLLAQGGNAAY